MATSPSISVAAATGTDLYISTPLSRPVHIHICHLQLSHELSHGDEPLHLGGAGTDLHFYTLLSRHAYIHMSHLHLSHKLSHGNEPLYFGGRRDGHRSIYLYPSL